MSKKVPLVPTDILTPVVQPSPPIIFVCSNDNQMIIAWKYAEPKKDCIYNWKDMI
ncbi:hypothetical protein [uncultured Pedobacter sp.]|uniref:hypothetical protein n=1 Tax=uncultured Pedobacter sp. TaxID=246139 RepID=UPI0025E29B21|nr:hypothetical protein [uncultured Pedobacter sp.]